MGTVKFLVASVALAAVLGLPASAKDDLSAQGILAIGKMAGACGILDSMIQFQQTTKLDGGDEFVTRFWSVEAARLGLSVEQLSTKCNQSVSAYGKLWDAAETP
ncbi:MAG: hypothetical protein ACT4O3_08995 [Elusimicrobiota bacterium]